jgi:hypothetical protein
MERLDAPCGAVVCNVLGVTLGACVAALGIVNYPPGQFTPFHAFIILVATVGLLLAISCFVSCLVILADIVRILREHLHTYEDIETGQEEDEDEEEDEDGPPAYKA